jgi:hypothetical protein
MRKLIQFIIDNHYFIDSFKVRRISQGWEIHFTFTDGTTQIKKVEVK